MKNLVIQQPPHRPLHRAVAAGGIAIGLAFANKLIIPALLVLVRPPGAVFLMIRCPEVSRVPEVTVAHHAALFEKRFNVKERICAADKNLKRRAGQQKLAKVFFDRFLRRMQLNFTGKREVNDVTGIVQRQPDHIPE
jgi:hypothetical protein